MMTSDGNGGEDGGNGNDHSIVEKNDCDGDCRAVTIAPGVK